MSIPLLVDIVFAFLLVTFTGRGFWRGFSGELFSLAGTIGGVIGAWKFGPSLGGFLATKMDLSPTLLLVLSMVLIYVIIALLAALLCRLVKAFLKITQLSFADRFFGGIAGVLKTGIIVLFVYFVCIVFSPLISTEWMSESLSMRSASFVWPKISHYFPDFELPSAISFDVPEKEIISQGEETDDS